MIIPGNAPANAWEVREKGTGSRGGSVRKRIRLGDAIAQAMNHMTSVMDKVYTSESVNISSERIFTDISEVKGLE